MRWDVLLIIVVWFLVMLAAIQYRKYHDECFTDTCIGCTVDCLEGNKEL